MNSRRILSQVALVAGTLLFSVGLQAFAAYTPPSTTPPNADAYAPLNTGPDAQTKIGGLNISTGNVGIGIANPFQKLEVAGYVKGTGICIGSDCITSWPSSTTAGATIVYKQAAGCDNGGALSDSPTCVTKAPILISKTPAGCVGLTSGYNSVAASASYNRVASASNRIARGTGGYVPPCTYNYNSYNCAGGAIGGYSQTTCLNTSVGALVASSANNDTATVWRPSTSQTISCNSYAGGMTLPSYARYDAATNKYYVSGTWAPETAVVFGQNVQGCYPAGGCGEAQSNQSVNNSVTTTYSRNASGGVTTTVTNQVYLSGSFWLSNGRGSGTCTASFN